MMASFAMAVLALLVTMLSFQIYFYSRIPQMLEALAFIHLNNAYKVVICSESGSTCVNPVTLDTRGGSRVALPTGSLSWSGR